MLSLFNQRGFHVPVNCEGLVQLLVLLYVEAVRVVEVHDETVVR